MSDAIKLLSLPRVVGVHPDDNEPITTNFGRFGPYVKHGDEFRSLESEDDVFNISFDAALALLRDLPVPLGAYANAGSPAAAAGGEIRDAIERAFSIGQASVRCPRPPPMPRPST